MGLYLTIPTVKGKCDWLLVNYPEIKETSDPIFDLLHQEWVIAIIQNPDFDSAVVMEDSSMVQDTFYRDQRHIRWVVIPNNVIRKLVMAGYCSEAMLRLLEPPLSAIVRNNEKLSEMA